MKRLLLMIVVGCLLATPCFCADEIAAKDLRFCTDADIKAMKSCIGTVERLTPCSAQLKTSDGKRLLVGSPDAPGDVVLFIHTLQEGGSYKLPGAFIDYQRMKREQPVQLDRSR